MLATVVAFAGGKADASRRGRWEAAYLELILGANRKLDGKQALPTLFPISDLCCLRCKERKITSPLFYHELSPEFTLLYLNVLVGVKRTINLPNPHHRVK